MDEILIFLSENYFYVLGIGLVLIFILIGFLSSRKGIKTKKQNIEEGTMANINEVDTAGIDKVVEQINKQKEEDIEKIGEVEEDAFKVREEPVIPVNTEQVQPEEPVIPVNTEQVQPEEPAFSKIEPIEISEIDSKEEVFDNDKNELPLEELKTSVDEIKDLEDSFEFKPEESVFETPVESTETTETLNTLNEPKDQMKDIQSFDYVTDKSADSFDDNILVGEETINIEEEKI